MDIFSYHHKIDRVVQAIECPTSERDLAVVKAERIKVEQLLADASRSIYGFNTFLGHLDDRSMNSESQRILLEAHLVGPLIEIDSSFLNLLTKIKLKQLRNGGSGIHPDTFELLENQRDKCIDSAIGNWTASYSSGDVSCAAWYVKSLIEQTQFHIRYPGDLISLINGNFYSTATSLIAILKVDQYINQSIYILKELVSYVGEQNKSKVQLPVSIRDLCPLIQAIDHSMNEVVSSLEDRLNSSSFNPLFVDSAELLPVSQSSFLDFSLSIKIMCLNDVIQLISAYLLGVIRYISSKFDTVKTEYVQIPKVLNAHHMELVSSSSRESFGYAINESHGVEDIADFTLFRSLTVMRSILIFDGIIQTVRDVMSDLNLTFESYNDDLLYLDYPLILRYRSLANKFVSSVA